MGDSEGKETARHGEPGITERYPWIVAFVFGCLHGFGFAGALTAVGLPATDILLALFMFNAGVEIGQLVAEVSSESATIRMLLLKQPAALLTCGDYEAQIIEAVGGSRAAGTRGCVAVPPPAV